MTTKRPFLGGGDVTSLPGFGKLTEEEILDMRKREVLAGFQAQQKQMEGMDFTFDPKTGFAVKGEDKKQDWRAQPEIGAAITKLQEDAFLLEPEPRVRETPEVPWYKQPFEVDDPETVTTESRKFRPDVKKLVDPEAAVGELKAPTYLTKDNFSDISKKLSEGAKGFSLLGAVDALVDVGKVALDAVGLREDRDALEEVIESATKPFQFFEGTAELGKPFAGYLASREGSLLSEPEVKERQNLLFEKGKAQGRNPFLNWLESNAGAYEQSVEAGQISPAKQAVFEALSDGIELIPGVGMYAGLGKAVGKTAAKTAATTFTKGMPVSPNLFDTQTGKLLSDATKETEPLIKQTIPTAEETIMGGTAEVVLQKGVNTSDGVLRSISSTGDIPGAVDDIALIAAPPVNNPFGMPVVKQGLTKQEQIWNFGSKFLPITKKDEFGINLMKGREDVMVVADNLSTSMSNEFFVKYKAAFNIDKKGGIIGLENIVKGIPGNPLIADVAARFPLYQPHLTGEQINFLKGLEARLAPIRAQLDEVGLGYKASRQDIMEGGFYLPRGNALEEGVDQVKKVSKGPRGRGGYTKEETFDSAAEGIAKGYEYAPFRTALHSYIKEAGNDSATKWAGNVLKKATDENGNLIGSTPRMRLAANATFREGQNLARKIRDQTRRLIAANVRADERLKVADRAIRKADQAAAGEAAAIERAKGKATTSVGDRIKRTDKAKKRFIDNSGTYTGEDVKLVRAMVIENIAEGRTLVRSITRNINDLKNARAKVRTSDRLLEKLGKEYTETLDEAQTMVDDAYQDMLIEMPTRKTGKTYEKLVNQMDRLQDKWDNLAAKHIDLEDRVNDLGDAGDELLALDQIVKQNSKNSVKKIQEIAHVERLQTRLKTEFKMLEAEEARAIRIAEQAEKSEISRIKRDVDRAAGEAVNLDDRAAVALIEAEKRKQKLAALKQRKNDIAGELDHVQRIANTPPGGHALISREFNMGQMSFPAELANTVDSIFRSEFPTTGKYKYLSETIRSFNQLYASTTATLDHSAVGIHGLLGMYNDPNVTAKVFATDLKAWGTRGEELLGKFIDDFNRQAINSGRLTSEDWARQKLRIGGEDTEFMMGGAKGVSLLRKTPLIKEANRAFGFYGDFLRLKQADGEIADLMRTTGKSKDELIESGEAAGIAEGANATTGYSGKQFGGSVGDIALYAPKFLAARINNVVRTVTATVTDPVGAVEAVPFVGRKLRQITPGTRDIPIERRMARRAILRTIGSVVTLTYSINAAQGRETDMRLTFIDDDGNIRYNSNFMRIRAFGRDISLFGTYDSLMRMIVLVGTGQPLDAFRGMASGSVANAWDIISEKDAMGEPARADWMPGDNSWLAATGHVLESFAPFAGDELPHVIEKTWKGIGESSPATVGKAAGTMVMEIFGMKSAPLGYYDLINDIAKEKRGEPLPSDIDIPLIPEAIEELPGKAVGKIGEGLKKIGVERGLEQLGIRPTDEEIAAMKEKSPTAIGGDVGWDPDNLSKGERRAIMNDPRMIEYLDLFDASTQGGLSQAFDNLEKSYVGLEMDLIAAMESDGQNPRFGDLISRMKANRSAIWGFFEDSNKEELGEEDLEEMHIADKFGLRYWSRPFEPDPASGYLDWEKRDKEGMEILNEAMAVDPSYVGYVIDPSGPNENNYRSKRFNDQRVKDMVEEREADSLILKPYYEWPMVYVRSLDDILGPGADTYERIFVDYLKNPNKSEYIKMKDWALVDEKGNPVSAKMEQAIKDAQNLDFLLNDPDHGIQIQKELFREQPENWQIEAILWKWGDIKTPVNEIVIGFQTELRNRQVAEGSGLPMADLRGVQELIERELGTTAGTR